MGGACSTYGGKQSAYGVLVEKPEGKRKLERARRRWKNNIKMDFHELGCQAVDWIDLAQRRNKRRDFVNAVMNFRVSQNADNFLISRGTIRFSRRAPPHGVQNFNVTNFEGHRNLNVY